jgi:hypothetical protein
MARATVIMSGFETTVSGFVFNVMNEQMKRFQAAPV